MTTVSQDEIAKMLKQMEGLTYFHIETEVLRALIHMSNGNFISMLDAARLVAATGAGTTAERHACITGMAGMALQCIQTLYVFQRMSDSEYELEDVQNAKLALEDALSKLR